MTNVSNLPETLKKTGKFCLWRYERDPDGRETKRPYNPNTGTTWAKVDHPETFSTLDKAVSVFNNDPYFYAGIGAGIFGNLAGVDIDHCINRDTGVYSEAAADIMETLAGAYMEKSPSGTGVRILFTLPDDYRYNTDDYYIHAHNGVEIYAAGITNRFLTLTGDTLTPGRDLSEMDPGKLDRVLNKYMQRPKSEPVNAAPATPLDMTDAEILEKALNSNDSFRALWNGDITGYNSQSEADLALCGALAFWTGRDPVRIDNLFRSSGLMRKKWTRDDYRTDTINKAIANCSRVYDPEYRNDTITPADREGLQEMKSRQSDLNGPRMDLNEQGGNLPADDLEAVRNDPSALELHPGGVDAETQKYIDEYGPEMGPFIKEIYTDRFKPIPTGITGLDEFLQGGLIRQTLVLLGAEPGAGKTILASMIFESMAKNGIPTLYFNLEMSKDQLLARSLARIMYTDPEISYKTNAVEILQGYKHNPEMREKVEAAARKYAAEIGPFVKYNPVATSDLDEILKCMDTAGADAVKAGKPAPCVCLDYLHIVTSTVEKDSGEIIKRAVQRLKEYAEKYDTIVLAIAAQSRQANESGRAKLSAGRDTSALEYSGDLVLQLIGNDKVDKKNGSPDDITLYVTKSRFTSFDIDNGLHFIKHGGQSFLEQRGTWTNTPPNEKTAFDDPDDGKGKPARRKL